MKGATKVHVLRLPDWVRPSSSPFRYPAHSRDRGVEQDFHEWIHSGDEVVVVDDPMAADLHYLPVFWTRLHVNNGFAATGVEELQVVVDRALIDPRRTVVVCQYDDGPVIDVHGAIVGLASRKGRNGIDIPLLCDPPRSILGVPKVWQAGFSGNLATHPIRRDLQSAARSAPGFRVSGRHYPERIYGSLLTASRVALAPRGYGGDSFRFYEALHLGTAPALIGEEDVRPFKGAIGWDACSFWFTTPSIAVEVLRGMSPDVLWAMGLAARDVADRLRAPGWCRMFLDEVLERV